MNNIDKKINQLKKESRMGVMTHVVVGYPSLKETSQLVLLMSKCGVDFIELQIPFSDPLADGPTIMKACEKSLHNGTKIKDAMRIAKDISSKINNPLIFMAYFNNIFKYGVKKFCQDAKSAGISGLIVPDIPPEEEECECLRHFAKKMGLYFIPVLSPVSTIKRIKKNLKKGEGFVYCTAKQGTTGVSQTLNLESLQYLKKVKKISKVPIALGFGISSRKHLQQIKGNADIAVIGSFLINLIENSENNYQKKIATFLNSLQE
ncbi:tryptophan synthase subunit alpha [Candidatus Daviesbacteria bacterium]|nr:tryptophan synthase subunit alpha [Candidatus Daviesbacteria bacterium]